MLTTDRMRGHEAPAAVHAHVTRTTLTIEHLGSTDGVTIVYQLLLKQLHWVADLEAWSNSDTPSGGAPGLADHRCQSPTICASPEVLCCFHGLQGRPLPRCVLTDSSYRMGAPVSTRPRVLYSGAHLLVVVTVACGCAWPHSGCRPRNVARRGQSDELWTAKPRWPVLPRSPRRTARALHTTR